ncbi:MAG: flavin reductase like domain-containing protein [Linnemannia gamsii]|nr:MAG: flavin reductase like domain-containing protein [Linnemannia gamsii]
MLLPRSYSFATAAQSYSRSRTFSTILNACRSSTSASTARPVISYTLNRHRLYTTSSASASTVTFPQAVASDEDKASSEKFRKVLRKVPFPVVVISTCSPENPSLRRGITISSFSSISLQPVPLVSFCVKLPSRASTILHESDQFVIQFLSSEQIAHSVAFSSSVAPPPGVSKALSSGESGAGAGEEAGVNQKGKRALEDKDIEELVAEASRQTMIESSPSSSSNNHSTVTTTTTTTTTTPSSTPEPDPFEVLGYDTDPESNLPVLRNTLGAIRCRTHQVMVVGDHEMWIGHVEKVLHGEIPDEKEPLLYHDRSYRHVGRRIL